MINLKRKKTILFWGILFSLLLVISPVQASKISNPFRVQSNIDAQSYPLDPASNISWSSGVSGVADIQSAFNNARTQENNQLGTSISGMILPSQAIWDSMSDNEKALWLINQERVARGIMPLDSIEDNIKGVAQYYADYLFSHDAWGHYEDGNSPWDRLDNNPAIGACHDFLPVAENLAVFVTSGNNIALPIERSIYMWLYDDAGSGWGHRHAILWYPYSDNGGLAGQEGFLGIGRANGGPYKGPFSSSWNFAELIVMNVFDPCSTWAYPAPEVLSITRADHDPTGESTVNFTVTFSEVVSGVDISDFSLTTSGGISGASILTTSSNPNIVYNVSVNTGSGEGITNLDLKASNTNIINTAGMPINDGFTDGEFYTTLTPPDNDDFGSAIDIMIVPNSKNMNTEGATLADDDPQVTNCNLNAGKATVWYFYKHIGATSAISLDTLDENTSYDTFIAVWTGNRGSLVPIACNNDTGGTKKSTVAFQVMDGITYYIEIGQP